MADVRTIAMMVGSDGFLRVRGKAYRCAVGKGGIVPAAEKREGDGATPAGTFALRRVFFRSDRIATPATGLPTQALVPTDGWCDDSAHPAYNTLVPLPFPASHETLWRDDHVYDIIVPLGYNDDPPVPGRGSAIFLHVAREGYSPTAGCVALSLPDLLAVLAECTLESHCTIGSTLL